VLEYSCGGFATVIRLPLRDAAALQAVYDEFATLRAQTAPMLLFLGRLQRLTARVENAGAAKIEPVVLGRHEAGIENSNGALSIADLCATGSFLIARRAIPETVMKVAIKSGVDSKQLHPSWNDWKGDGEVALAVRLDEGLVSPRFYTYLPMGREAIAPFNGYLHGTFFPGSSRKSLDAGIELNRLILIEAASLAGETIGWLSRFTPAPQTENSSAVLDEAAAARATTDLLVWSEVASLDTSEDLNLSAVVASKAAAAVGADSLDEAAVIPCLAGGTGDARVKPSRAPVIWRQARSVRRWQVELPTFSVEVIARHGETIGIAPLWPGLGLRRIEALTGYLALHLNRHQDQPALTERAAIAASVAAEIPRGKKPALPRWTRFYNDLIPFMERNLSPLAGLEILFCSDGSLRPATRQLTGETQARSPRRRRRKGMVIEASVFAPPAPKGSSGTHTVVHELSPPTPLKPYFAFLTEALPWYGELAPVRVLLEGKLFDSFDSDTVLVRLSQVLARDGRKEARASGLRWAFLVWRRALESGRPIQLRIQHRFYAPTIDGDYIDASQAVFSATWPEETQGKRLQQFLDLAPIDSADLSALRARRLAPTSHRVFGQSRTAQWVAFLDELGVQHGLEPIEKKVARQISGPELSSFRFCNMLGISETAAAVWKVDVTSTVSTGTHLPSSTGYVVNGSLWWIPGQGDHERFSDECRELYSTLVTDWVGRAKSECWQVEIHHHYATYADTRRWPTPLASFLRASTWMPADEPSPEGSVRGYFAPKDIWLASEDGPERFPRFLRRPAPKLLRALERDPRAVKELVRSMGLRILNDPSTGLEQACFLAEQYRDGRVERYYELEFLNLYHRTWRSIAEKFDTAATALDTVRPPALIVVRHNGLNSVVDIGTSEDTAQLHVRDNDDEIAPGLIELTGGKIFDARVTDPARIGRVFKSFYANKVRLASEVRYELFVGTTPISQIKCDETVTTICPWLRVMAAVSSEALKGVEFQRLPLDRASLIERLERVRFHIAAKIAFRIDGKEIPADEAGRQAFALKTADGGVIVVALHEGDLTWAAVEASLPAICDAIEQPSLVPHMRLLARELDAIGEDVSAVPTGDLELDRLSKLLFLNRTAVAGIREILGARLDKHLPWLRAIAHLAGGEDGLAAFNAVEREAVQDIDTLQAALFPLIGTINLEFEVVLGACKHSLNVGEFRELLGLDFAQFNISLIAAGENPDVDPERHRTQLAHHIAEHEIGIIDALRNAFAPSLLKKTPAPDYARLRDALPSLAPDPSWLLVHEYVPEILLEAFVEKWLETAKGPRLGENPFNIPRVVGVRTTNIRAVRKFAEAVAPLVRTWCALNDKTAPELWRDPLSTDAKLRDALDQAGAFDFLPLDEAALLAWSSSIAVWPEEMPATLDREALGISSTDIEDEQDKAKIERAAREAKARSVTFSGTEIDPREANWDTISTAIEGALSRAALSTPIGSQANLQPMLKVRGSTKKHREKKNPGEPTVRVPQEKKDMIGRLGELVIYHWLKKRLPEQDIHKAWRSKNAFIITGRPGDDDLGYDFAITFRKQTLYIEVKASTGDPQQFEMGETEVRAARKAARPRSRERYVIAYVRDVGEPASTGVDLLPNPMTDEGSHLLQILGEGIRYGFRRG
jgi:hypothetical protein